MHGFSATVKTYSADNSLLASIYPKAEGFWMQHTTSPTIWTVRYTGTGSLPTEPDPIGFDVLWTPQWTTWSDTKQKRYSIQPTRGKKTGEAYMIAQNAWTQAGDLAKALDKESKAPGLELRPDAKVQGVPCHVVAVTLKPNTDPVLWYFGIEDNLPRRCEILMPKGAGGGALRVDFTDVVAAAPPLDADDWTITRPDGYDLKINPAYKAPEDRNPTRTIRTTVPQWEVADSEGVLLSPHSLRKKVTVLYFWGTWSPLCKKATPQVALLAKDYADKSVEIVSMAIRDGSPEAVVNAAHAQGQTWRQVPAADDAASLLGVHVVPSVVVLDDQGRVLFKSGRPKGNDYPALYARVRSTIDKALAGKSAKPIPAIKKGTPMPRIPGK